MFLLGESKKPGNTKVTSVNRLSSLLFCFRIFQILDFVHFYKNEPQGKSLKVTLNCLLSEVKYLDLIYLVLLEYFGLFF